MTGAVRPARRWVIAGRVQGVGFRWFVLRRAEALDVHGWARNLPDGRVEVVASGPETSLESLDAVLRTGPTQARVSSVESAVYQHEVNADKRFEIR